MAPALLQLYGWFRTALPRRTDDRGAAAVEYALLLVLIALVLIIAVTTIGETTSNGLDDAGNSGFGTP